MQHCIGQQGEGRLEAADRHGDAALERVPTGIDADVGPQALDGVGEGCGVEGFRAFGQCPGGEGGHPGTPGRLPGDAALHDEAGRAHPATGQVAGDDLETGVKAGAGEDRKGVGPRGAGAGPGRCGAGRGR